MRVRPVAPARRLLILAGIAALAVGLAACGKTGVPSSIENDGVYVNAGPITYQLQVSRALNPYDTEDSQYIKGLPAGSTSLRASELWYGVFLWAKNQTKQSQVTASSFDIVSTDGVHYFPLPINPALNGYAYTSQVLAPNAIEPAPDTQASLGPTQGSLLLFKLPDSIYSNRPLTLEIRGPSGRVWATISLDL